MGNDSSQTTRTATPAERSSAGRRLRADAIRNRAAVLSSAGQVFAERGIDAPLTAVARHAGVGVATLFRHFPNREALLTAVFAEHLHTCETLLATALTDADPWQGFCGFIEAICEVQCRDRGFSVAFLVAHPDAEHEAPRIHAERSLEELVRRAKGTGQLRPDFAARDLVLILLANGGVTNTPPEMAAATSRRLVAYLLDAFAAHPTRGESGALLPAAPDIGVQQVIRGGA